MLRVSWVRFLHWDYYTKMTTVGNHGKEEDCNLGVLGLGYGQQGASGAKHPVALSQPAGASMVFNGSMRVFQTFGFGSSPNRRSMISLVAQRQERRFVTAKVRVRFPSRDPNTMLVSDSSNSTSL
jgi:hypothetical protein